MLKLLSLRLETQVDKTFHVREYYSQYRKRDCGKSETSYRSADPTGRSPAELCLDTEAAKRNGENRTGWQRVSVEKNAMLPSFVLFVKLMRNL
jgi:hypothetical protein